MQHGKHYTNQLRIKLFGQVTGFQYALLDQLLQHLWILFLILNQVLKNLNHLSNLLWLQLQLRNSLLNSRLVLLQLRRINSSERRGCSIVGVRTGQLLHLWLPLGQIHNPVVPTGLRLHLRLPLGQIHDSVGHMCLA